MGYIKPAETDLLTLPSDPKYTVYMKKRASYGDIEAANASMLKIDTDLTGGRPQVGARVQWQSYITSLLLSLIVSWNLTDENDAILPITASSINKLDPDDGLFLAKEADTRSRPRDQAAEIPFAKPSSDS